MAERTAGASAVGAPTSRGETIDSSASASTGARARGHKFTTSRSKESQKDFFFWFVLFLVVLLKSCLHNVCKKKMVNLDKMLDAILKITLFSGKI